MGGHDPSALDGIDMSLLQMIDDRFTYQEMAEAVNRSAKSGIFRRMERLIFLGLVTKTRKSRSRRLTDAGQRLLHQVAADRRPKTPE